MSFSSSDTRPKIEVKKVGETVIYLIPETGKFEADLKRPNGRIQTISRAKQADVEREILKQTTSRIPLLRGLQRKGRVDWDYTTRPATKIVVYGPSRPADIPDEVVIVADGGKRQYSNAVFRTESGDFVGGPFYRPNPEGVERLRVLRAAHDAEIERFQRNWDAIVDEFEQVTPETLTAELRSQRSERETDDGADS